MKQILLAIGFFMMITSSKNSSAQNNNEVASNYPSSDVGYNTKPAEKKMIKNKVTTVNSKVRQDFILSHKNLVKTTVTSVNIKAVRDFARSHKNISDATWFKTDVGYIAFVPIDGILTKTVYNNKGRWMYNLLSYTEDKMIFDIRDLVKSKYYDNNIIVVYQYEFENKTIYIIRMRDKKSNIITIKVCDKAIEDITDRDEK